MTNAFAKILAIAAGLGSWIFLDITWWIGLIVAAGTYLVTKGDDPNPVLVQTIDLTTGVVKTRPNDRAAQKYLNTLND